MKDLSQTLKEVAELEERFLEADEMLDELPNPETPDEDDEMSEAEHVLNSAMHGVESLHGLLTILKRPAHQGALLKLLGEDQLNALNDAQEVLDKLIGLMSGVEMEAADEEEAEAEEEDPTEEPSDEEEETTGDEEEEKEDEAAKDDDKDKDEEEDEDSEEEEE